MSDNASRKRDSERRTRVHHRPAVLEQHLAGQQPRIRARGGGGCERRLGTGLEPGVVVQEKHPVGSPFERTADADVVAAREAEVGAVAQQFDGREATLHLLGRAVGGSVVDADRLDPGKRRERARRVVAAVPVEHDRDELHRSVLA